MKIDVLLFTQTMSSLLKSSLSLQDALDIYSEICENKKDKKFYMKISQNIKNGNLLSSELSNYEKYFSVLYISLVKIGENSGTMIQVFEKLADYLKVKKETKEKIMQCLLYPIIVLLTAIVIVFIIMFYVLPRLQGIFEAFADNSKNILENVIQIKFSLLVFGIIVIFATVSLCLLFCCYKISKRGKQKFALTIDNLLLQIPFLGKYLLTVQLNDFAFTMKLLTSTYYSFTESLMLSKSVCTNLKIKKSIYTIYKKISEGNSIGKCFSDEKIFPAYLVTWIRVAETSGNTEEVFSQIYEYYSNENTNTISKIVISAEPFFIITTGIIIISIIFQFVLPIFKMMGEL